MNKKLRILFCAEDYGSLEQNLFLIKLLAQKKLLNKKKSLFICNNLFRNKIEQKYIPNNFFFKDINKRNKKKITQFLDKNNIDLAVVGLSIKPKSIDYKVTKIINKRKIKSLSIQDFWGHIGNFDNKVFPNYLFVADKYAKKLSIGRTRSKIIISGLPKYLKKKSLFNFKNNNKKNNLLMIGQPEFIPGINLYYKFLDRLNILNFDNVYYLPHPLEKKIRIFLKRKKVKIVNRENISRVLNRNLIVVNSFSTFTYDLLFSANFFKKEIFYKMIFITFQKKLINFVKKTVGDKQLPLIKYRNIFQLSNLRNSDIEFEKILKNKFFNNKLTKGYFLKYHSEKFFLREIKRLVKN